MINVFDVWPATSSGGKLNLNFQSKIPPQDILLCLRDCVWYQAHVGSIESRSPHRQPSSETKYWKSRLQTTSEIWKIYQIGSDPGLEIFPDNVLGLPKVNWVLSFVHSLSNSPDNISLDLIKISLRISWGQSLRLDWPSKGCLWSSWGWILLALRPGRMADRHLTD